MNEFKYLVLSGGAQNGIMFLGAMTFLENILLILHKNNIKGHFRGFAGTSVGALILFCVLCDVHEKEIDFLFSVPVQDLNKAINLKLREILISRYGNADITFDEFFIKTNKLFKVCATNLCDLSTRVFDVDKTPHVSIVNAINASIALPVIFDPVIINNEMYVDGGCQYNLPFNVFPAKKTLAFWIRIKPETLTVLELKNSTTYVKRIAETFFYTQDSFIESILINQKKRNIVCFECRTPGFIFQKVVNTDQLKKLGATFLFEHFKRKKEVCFVWHLYDIFAFMFVIVYCTKFKISF